MQNTIDAEAMQRESAKNAGELFNRASLLAGQLGAARARIAELEAEVERNRANNVRLCELEAELASRPVKAIGD